MGSSAPTFRYFREPRAEVVTTWQDEPGTCELCGSEAPGYSGPFTGEQDCDFVCERCLADGKLQDAGLSTNEATSARSGVLPSAALRTLAHWHRRGGAGACSSQRTSRYGPSRSLPGRPHSSQISNERSCARSIVAAMSAEPTPM